MSITNAQRTREALLRRLSRLARRSLFGTLSESYRTCGRPGCRCQQGEKHGPHLYVSFRGSHGTTTGYYVPQALAAATRAGVAAWRELEGLLRELAERNREQLWAANAARGLARKARRRHGSSRVRATQPVRGAAPRRKPTVGSGAAPDRRSARG